MIWPCWGSASSPTTRSCREKWEKPTSFRVPRRIHWDKATMRKFFKAHGRKCTAAFGLWVVFWTWELTHSPPSMNSFFLTNSTPAWCPKPLSAMFPCLGLTSGYIFMLHFNCQCWSLQKLQKWPEQRNSLITGLQTTALCVASSKSQPLDSFS